MAEPNHNADEQLKRYAADRRAQAPRELHPANRRALQAEVATIYGRGAVAGPWWRRLIIPQFAWGLALVAILGLSVLTLRQPTPPPTEIPAAKEKKESQAKDSVSLGLEVALESADEKKQERDLSLRDAPSPSERWLAENAPRGRTAPSAPARADIADREMTEAKTAAGRRVEEERLSRTREVAATPPPAASAPAPKAELGAVVKQNAPTQVLSFSNFAAPAQKPQASRAAAGVAGDSRAAENVLTRFTLLQAGDQLQVTDADGSLYKGNVVTQQPAQNFYAFRVSGTNNTLRQPVTFTGQVVQVQTAAGQAVLNNTYSRNAQNQNNSFYDNSQQLRLQGQAQVGPNANVNVDAQNVAPAQR